MARKTAKRRVKEMFEEQESQQGDFAALLDSVKEKPWHYGIAAVFVLGCVAAAFLYSETSAGSDREITAKYAAALEQEEPAQTVAKLEEIADVKSAIQPDALYMMGETAYKAKEYDKAKAAFERTRSEFPKSTNAPDAVEGLGFIAEQGGEYDVALACYDEILQKWSMSFAARRQYLNIGRCQEQLGKLPEAVRAYDDQVRLFPGSNVAEDATAALDRLRQTNPELFPDKPVAEETPQQAEGDAAAAGAGAGDAPAENAQPQ